MKRVRIKDVRRFPINPGLRIYAGPYHISLPLKDERAVRYTKRWLSQQPWGRELIELVKEAGITLDELREFLIGKYVVVYRVSKVFKENGPYAGTFQYYVN